MREKRWKMDAGAEADALDSFWKRGRGIGFETAENEPENGRA